jgi:hypothetical protein
VDVAEDGAWAGSGRGVYSFAQQRGEQTGDMYSLNAPI